MKDKYLLRASYKDAVSGKTVRVLEVGDLEEIKVRKRLIQGMSTSCMVDLFKLKMVDGSLFSAGDCNGLALPFGIQAWTLDENESGQDARLRILDDRRLVL